MGSFFKALGQGVLDVLCLPLLIVFLALYAVYCLLIMIYECFRTICIYFAGGSPFKDLKEDVKAKKILFARANGNVEEVKNVTNNQTTTSNTTNTTINYFNIDASSEKAKLDAQKIKDLIEGKTEIVDANASEDEKEILEIEPKEMPLIEEAPAVKRPENLDDIDSKIKESNDD